MPSRRRSRISTSVSRASSRAWVAELIACWATTSWAVSDSAVRAARVRDRRTSRSASRSCARVTASRAAASAGCREARSSGISAARASTAASSEAVSSRDRTSLARCRSRSTHWRPRGRMRAMSVRVRVAARRCSAISWSSIVVSPSSVARESRAAPPCWSSSCTSRRASSASSWSGRTPAARCARARVRVRASWSGAPASTAAQARRAAACVARSPASSMPAADASEAATSAAEAASTAIACSTEAVTARVVSSSIHRPRRAGASGHSCGASWPPTSLTRLTRSATAAWWASELRRSSTRRSRSQRSVRSKRPVWKTCWSRV